jgi:integrase
MGVFGRPDSKYWWLWLETAPQGQQRERTRILKGITRGQQQDSRRLAEQVYHLRMNEIAERIHRLPVRRETLTFSTFADWYEKHVVAHQRSAERGREILKVLRAAFGPRPLQAIEARDVIEWRSVRVREVAASTCNRELDVLKAMFRTAVPAHLETSPLIGLRRLRVERRETFVLSLEAEQRLLDVLEPRDRALIVCALDTLMRLSDVLNLRREQDRNSYLVVEDPKVKPYRVPVSSRLRVALDGLPKTGQYYFAHRRVAESPRDWRSGIASMLERACLKAKIPYGQRRGGLTFHALRHTGATRLVEHGVSIRIVQEIGGWQSLRQLERYAHPSDAVKRAAVELIGGATP